MEAEGGAEQRSAERGNKYGSKEEKKNEKEGEGRFLLGWPTFVEMANGRLRCVETGHELPDRERESYSRSKACRRALIDAALSSKKPPLNLFHPHSLSKSKLVCELTGDTVNKSEEHVWKHINGRRFQNKLEQWEKAKLASVEKTEKDVKQAKKQQRKTVTVKNNQEDIDASTTLPSEPVTARSSDSEEPDFWVPPVGDRWDFDDGKDCWESCMSSHYETDDDVSLGGADQRDDNKSGELAIRRTKRMSIAVGPSSFASRKKKIKKNPF